MICLQYILQIKGIEQKEIANELDIKKQNIHVWINKERPIPQKYSEYFKQKLGYCTNFLQQDLTDKLHDRILLNEMITMHDRKDIMYERQKRGISIAKDQGRYKGRPPIEYPKEWNKYYIAWKTGKITATKAMEILNLKRNTFYKLVKDYNANQSIA